LADRVSQLVVETLVTPTDAKARTSQIVVEVLRSIPPPSIEPPFIGDSTVLYAPRLTPPPISSNAPFISAATTLYAPSLKAAITPGFIAPTTVLYAPHIPLQIRMHFIEAREFIVSPKLRANITNVVGPTLEGTPQVGLVMTCWPGIWSGPPTTISYQWQYDAPGWTNIAGATSSSYIIGAAISGKNLRCQVTAS